MTVTEIKLPPTATNASQVIMEICELHEKFEQAYYDGLPFGGEFCPCENHMIIWKQYRKERDQILIKHNYTAEELVQEAGIRLENGNTAIHLILDILFE